MAMSASAADFATRNLLIFWDWKNRNGKRKMPAPSAVLIGWSPAEQRKERLEAGPHLWRRARRTFARDFSAHGKYSSHHHRGFPLPAPPRLRRIYQRLRSKN